jgi:hypothetical protein
MAIESDVKTCELNESGFLRCSIKKSKFDYSLIVRPDGSVEIQDKCGNILRDMMGSKELPPIKEIVNTRTITIVEATGSRYIYIDPPGAWFPVPY